MWSTANKDYGRVKTSIKTCDRLVLPTAVANETESLKTNIWVKLNQRAKIPINFLNDYYEADGEEQRRLSLAIFRWNYENPAVRKSKYWQFRHHNNCGSTRPTMAASDLGSASGWSCRVGNLFQPIRSTTHLAGKLVVASPNVGCFFRLAMMGSQEQTMMNSR